MPNPGGWARRQFLFRAPFVEVWAQHSPAGRGAVLAYWIAKAAADPWAFAQLRTLAAHLRDAGADVPAPLAEFVWQIGVGRATEPTRRGPKSDPRRDAAIAAAVLLLQEDEGLSLRKAAETVGKHMNLSVDGCREVRLFGEFVTRVG